MNVSICNTISVCNTVSTHHIHDHITMCRILVMPVWLGLVWSVCRGVLANFFYFPVSTTSTSPSSTETLCNQAENIFSFSHRITHTTTSFCYASWVRFGFGLVVPRCVLYFYYLSCHHSPNIKNLNKSKLNSKLLVSTTISDTDTNYHTMLRVPPVWLVWFGLVGRCVLSISLFSSAILHYLNTPVQGSNQNN